MGEIWTGDTLHREEDAYFLTNFITKRIEERKKLGVPKSYVLNLNGKWGTGKTYFLQRLQRQLEEDGYVATYINAWRDDHADTPLISIMSAIDETFQPLLKKKSKTQKTLQSLKTNGIKIGVAATKGVAKVAIKKVIGEDAINDISQLLDIDKSKATELAEALTDGAIEGISSLTDSAAEKLLESFRETTSSIKKFRSDLGALLEDAKIKLPYFVLIDELDRCRPLYAVQTLEQVKHLFEVDNVAFIIATDSSQLAFVVNAVYGNRFDSTRYLRRFFDRTYQFPEAPLSGFVENLFSSAAIEVDRLSAPLDMGPLPFAISAFEYFGASLRDVEQCFDLMRSTLTIWPHPIKLELIYLLPLIISHHLHLSSTDLLSDLFTRDEFKAKEWAIAFKEETMSGTKLSRIDMRNVFSRFISEMPKALTESAANRDQSPVNNWVAQRFQEEFRIIHHNQYIRGKEPRSLALLYPEMVKSVLRLHR